MVNITPWAFKESSVNICFDGGPFDFKAFYFIGYLRGCRMDSGGAWNQIRGRAYHGLLSQLVSGRHGAVIAAAIYFMPSLHYLLASFNLITSALTVVGDALKEAARQR